MESFNFINPYVLLSLNSTIIILLLTIFVIFRNPQGVLNKAFGIYTLFVVQWVFFGSFLGDAALNAEDMLRLVRISAVGGVFVAPLFLIFVLVFTKSYRWLRSIYTYIFLFGFNTVLYFWIVEIDLISPGIFERFSWGWEYRTGMIPPGVSFTWIWNNLLIFLALFLLWRFSLKTKDSLEKKQSRFIIIAELVPVILGIIVGIIMPRIDIQSPIPGALYSLSGVFLVVVLGYATVKYKLFAFFTPQAAADTIIETIKEALVVTDSKDNIVLINPFTSELLGYQKNELVGLPLSSLFSRKDLEKLEKDTIPKIKEEGVITDQEMGFTHKSGESVTVSLSASDLRDEKGQFIGIVMVARDIRELREKTSELAEKVKALEISSQESEQTRLATLNILEDIGETSEALEIEKERIENIILFLADGLLVLQDSEISLSNPSAKAIFGITANDIIKKSADSLQKYQNLKILFQFLEENKKRPVLRREIVFQKPERTFQITVISISAGQDLIILHDVTREKLIEQMKTEFVSLAAHQLRTPLSAVKWTLRMILDEDLGKITKDQRDFLEKTYLSNERMISLINDLLNVARIEEGRYLYKLSLYRLEDIVQSVVNSYIDEAKRKKITFTFKKPKRKSPKLKIDIEKMNSAIQNIIDNAIRYTHQGGRVTVSLKSGRKEIELRVQDSGIGVPENQQERVFSKFFRGVNVMRMETEGSGLGLFITKNIIEAHGGKIWFESEENKGTTIYLTLPIK